MTQSVLKSWTLDLGLRHQGVLLSAIRGCDTSPRHDKSKVFQRVYRSEILNSHTGDAAKSKSFIMGADVPTTRKYAEEFLEDCDHYPLHYMMHMVHAAEILGYYHPDHERRDLWHSFYLQCRKKFHLSPETITDLNKRLNAEEEEFHRNQTVRVETRAREARYGGT